MSYCIAYKLEHTYLARKVCKYFMSPMSWNKCCRLLHRDKTHLINCTNSLFDLNRKSDIHIFSSKWKNHICVFSKLYSFHSSLKIYILFFPYYRALLKWIKENIPILHEIWSDFKSFRFCLPHYSRHCKQGDTFGILSKNWFSTFCIVMWIANLSQGNKRNKRPFITAATSNIAKNWSNIKLNLNMYTWLYDFEQIKFQRNYKNLESVVFCETLFTMKI